MPPEVVREWELAAQDMVRTPGFVELVGKLKGTPSFMGHDEFQASVTGVYRQMAKLVLELGMKKD
jgi:tripartite-type tricarboxylate transporter receptor subunit TctC